MSTDDILTKVAAYLTRNGWGVGTQHVVDNLNCTVTGHGANGDVLVAVCKVNGQEHLPEKVARFDWPVSL